MTVLQKLIPHRAKAPFLTLVEGAPGPSPEPIYLEQDIVSIGRADENGIRLPDANISKRHCLLVKTPSGVKLVDLESTNGCFVNDERVKERTLRDGDRVGIGPFTLCYRAGGFVPPPPPVFAAGDAVARPFAELLVEQLRRTPFWLISATVHLVLLVVVWNLEFVRRPGKPAPKRVEAAIEIPAAELWEEEEQEPETETPLHELTIEAVEESYVPPVEAKERDAESAEADAGENVIGPAGARGSRVKSGSGLFDAGRLEGALRGTRFGQHVAEMRGVGLDVCMVFDSTGSMQGIIDQVKAQIAQMNTYMSALIPGNYRLAMVTYRDKNDEYETRHAPFTDDSYQILDFVERVNAAGGDDIPEGVLAGLKVAVQKLQWRRDAQKVILLFGDAPPHERELEGCLGMAGRFKRQKGVVHAIYTEVGAREESLDNDGKRAVAAFRSIARYGGGTFSFLDQESQIVRAIRTLIFGREWQKDVERVDEALDFGWKGRLIRRKVKARDVPWLLERFRHQVHPLIVDGLITIRDRDLDRALMAMARGDAPTPAHRSAARYVLLKKGFDVR